MRKKVKYAAFVGVFALGSQKTLEDEMKVEGKLRVANLCNHTYRPSHTLLNPHLVTWLTGIATAYHKETSPPFIFTRSPFLLSDGAQIAIDSSEKLKDKPLIIIIPGLQGSVADHYIHTLVAKIKGQYEWTVINYRGINLQLKTGIPLSAGDFDSFKEPI